MFQKLLDRYSKLRSSYKHDRQKQNAMLHVNKEELAADTSFMKELWYSKDARSQIFTTLRHVKTGKDITLPQYNFFLRYTAARMAYSNAQQSGDVLNVRLKEYKKGKKKDPVDGDLHVRVSDHKTVDSHSCADIFIDEFTTGLVDDYIHYLRPETKSSCLFVHHTGEPLLSKDFAYELKRLGITLGIELPSITAARKLTSS